MYDIIGDIHGHADELKALLKKLGYSPGPVGYSHPERKAIFVGDYIDRGPRIRETLSIVRSMVDAGKAVALMGNHEYNAICYHTEGENGRPLREHSEKNIKQHAKTLAQFESSRSELNDYLNWFMALPLFFETDQFRVVHACWDAPSIQLLQRELKGNLLNLEALHNAHNSRVDLFNAIEITLKGKEVPVPPEFPFIDKDQHKRNEIRIRWWLDPRTVTTKQYSIHPYDADLTLAESPGQWHYTDEELPVFFGHYWLEGTPELFRNNICCLDYSVAKEGKLVAYRYHGDLELKDDGFVW